VESFRFLLRAHCDSDECLSSNFLGRAVESSGHWREITISDQDEGRALHRAITEVLQVLVDGGLARRPPPDELLITLVACAHHARPSPCPATAVVAAVPLEGAALRRWKAILAAARDYAHRETDLRGYTGARGWAHAAAHTADLLARLAKLPSFTDDDRAIMLDAVAGFIVRRHGEILHHGEDGRLAVAVVAAARAGIAPPALVAWLGSIKTPIAERGGPAFDAGRYAAQRNARNLLFTLFVQVSVMPAPSDGERRLLDAVRAVLVE